MRTTILGGLAALALVAGTAGTASAAPNGGLKDWQDTDGNGIADAGVQVTGHYTAFYAEDASGAWYMDYGQGRTPVGTVTSPDLLDQETRTDCNYVVNYRGTFENTPYQDSGTIFNSINCTGYTKSHTTYLMVHKSDPRYTGTPELALWGDWEYHVLTQSGEGNLANLQRPEKSA